MIPIKINNKKYKIKSIDELTTSEYIELDGNKDFDIVKYIQWQTKCDFNDAFFATTSKGLEIAIGQKRDITKMPMLVVPYFDYKKTLETVGHRYQIEQSGLDGLKLLVFCLAVAQANDTNIDRVNQLVKYYNRKPWQEILPAGFFFFKNYRNGRSFAQGCLMRLMDRIRILVSKSKQVLKI